MHITKARITSLAKDSFKVAVPAGLLGGALGGLVEALYLAINYDFYRITIFATGIFYYSILGLAAAVILAAGVTFVTGIFSGAKRIANLDLIIFAAIFTYLVSRFSVMYMLRRFLSISYESAAGILIIIFLCSLIWLVGFLIIWLFRRINRSLGLSWAKSGVVVYLVVLILMIGSILLVPVDEPEFEAYDVQKAINAADKPNIIFIVIDCLRYDWISVTKPDVNTPNIEMLVNDGIFYTNSFAHCSWTKPSFVSLFTSLYTAQHNVMSGRDIINPSLTTLAQVLGDIGYYTVGFHNNPHLRIMSNFHIGFNYYQYLVPDTFYPIDPDAPIFVYSQYFQSIARRLAGKEKAVSTIYQDAVTTSNTVIDWVENNKEKKFYMFVHYMDPHEPYFERPLSGEIVVPPKQYSREALDRIAVTYTAEVEYTDNALGLFFDYLKENGLYDNSLIILTADHGEEFYDHGGWSHGQTLFDEVIKVPLIVKLPDSQSAGDVDSSLVEGIDIAPTIVEFVKGEIPATWEGKDIISDAEIRWSYADLEQHGPINKSLRSLTEKLYLAGEPHRETIDPINYFDMENDPQEKNNLAYDPQFESRVEALNDSIEAMELRMSANTVEAMQGEIDEATKERLRALGYIE